MADQDVPEGRTLIVSRPEAALAHWPIIAHLKCFPCSRHTCSAHSLLHCCIAGSAVAELVSFSLTVRPGAKGWHMAPSRGMIAFWMQLLHGGFAVVTPPVEASISSVPRQPMYTCRNSMCSYIRMKWCRWQISSCLAPAVNVTVPAVCQCTSLYRGSSCKNVLQEQWSH